MKAPQFIKDHGLKKAREVVEGAPEWASGINLHSMKYFGGDCFCRGDVLLLDIERLVESVDLVNSLGGLQGARKEAHRDCFAFEKNKPLLRAINDYESIYGEGNAKF